MNCHGIIKQDDVNIVVMFDATHGRISSGRSMSLRGTGTTAAKSNSASLEHRNYISSQSLAARSAMVALFFCTQRRSSAESCRGYAQSSSSSNSAQSAAADWIARSSGKPASR